VYNTWPTATCCCCSWHLLLLLWEESVGSYQLPLLQQQLVVLTAIMLLRPSCPYQAALLLEGTQYELSQLSCCLIWV
jgi:hypothetical protein